MGAPCAIVPEVLTKENYGRWKIWMKNYLMGEELWEIVDGTEPKPDQATRDAEFRIWRKKNGKALHAIQVSCGAEIFDHIYKIDSAKDAWDRLLAWMDPLTFTEEPSELPGSSSLYTQGPSTDDKKWCLPLYNAVVKGDWESTKSLVKSHPEALSSRLSLMGETILHTAVLHKHEDLVAELVHLMSTQALELSMPDRGDVTALHLAAYSGIVKMAMVMVKKNANLARIRDRWGFLPVARVSHTGHKEMAHYLYSVTPAEELNCGVVHNGASLLIHSITAEDFDFALSIHRSFPQFFTAKNVNGATALEELARMSSSFPCGSRLMFWQRWINKYCITLQSPDDSDDEGNLLKKVPGIKEIYDEKLKHKQALELLNAMSEQLVSTFNTFNTSQIQESRLKEAMLLASKYGNVEFIVKMVKSVPTLLRIVSQSGGIFHIAVAHRQERIWNLIYDFGTLEGGEFPSSADENSNTLLHLAAMLAPATRLNNIAGPAMKMQRELQWFKEVEMTSPVYVKEHKNKTGKRPRALFTEEHKDLVKEGERWMKDTAQSCMLVATLIATVMFAAAFTVPGGIDDLTGTPKFLGQKTFKIFIISDALSLFSSTISVLMFLSILTSRYAEEDFLKSLPKRLIIGLATLSFSVATMMVAFSATLVIVFNDQHKWTAIPVSLLASVPVTLFVLLQFPLFINMVSSTYGSDIFGKQKDLLVNSIPADSTGVQYWGP